MIPDPWHHLRKLTPARIALGRAGGSLPTGEVLRFAMDHALARDAVWAELDLDALERCVNGLGLPVLRVTTRAADRATYLKRPDLGRQLSEPGEEVLANSAGGNSFDVSLLIADGLSALAANRHAPALLAELVSLLQSAGLSLGPIVLASQARVALQDEVGYRLGARCSVILLGERPGLGAPDSLGAYFVFNPKPGNTDADRNCVSNIRPDGLPLAEAARTLHYLVRQSLVRQLSGVGLKDDRTPALQSPARSSGLPQP